MGHAVMNARESERMVNHLLLTEALGGACAWTRRACAAADATARTQPGAILHMRRAALGPESQVPAEVARGGLSARVSVNADTALAA